MEVIVEVDMIFIVVILTSSLKEITMTKQYLEYDPVSGAITDSAGCPLPQMYPGYIPVTVTNMFNVEELIRLKAAGFTAEEIKLLKE
jgi:hypothetical protein